MKKKNINPDLLIIGAGPVGCVIAERAARIKKWSSLIIEKRNHIAGNCYDKLNSKVFWYTCMDPITCVLRKKEYSNM